MNLVKQLARYMPFSYLNTAEEWHSFVIGFFEGLTVFIPARISAAGKPRNMIKREYWYYSYGRGAGLVAAVLALIGLAKLIQAVIL